MEKVLIASFDREEEQDFEELVLFLKEKGYRDFTGMASADNVLKYNDLKINPKYRMVRNQGEDIKLTNYEFDILYLLAKRPGQVFSKEQIYSQVWKEPYYGAEDNVMSLIRRIRKKIEPDPSHPIYILTVWGMNSSWNYVNAISRKGNFLCSSCVTKNTMFVTDHFEIDTIACTVIIVGVVVCIIENMNNFPNIYPIIRDFVI